MADRDWQTLTTMFFDQAARHGDKPFLWAKQAGKFAPLTWREAADTANRLARGLHALGVRPGDRVVLASENRPEWLIADIAIMAAGAITVPANTTNTVGDHLHILNNSGAMAAIASSRQIADRMIPAAQKAAAARFVVTVDALSTNQTTVDRHGWDEVLAMGDGAPDNVADTVAEAKRRDVACIIYTSGTGGAPKGVMLSHGAILSNCTGAYDLLLQLGLDEEVFLSFLPLSHSYEHTAGQFFPIYIGAEIYYAESIDQLMPNMAEARPTLMTAVPRLYEMAHLRIRREIDRIGGIKAKLFNATLALGRKKVLGEERLSPLERIEDRALDLLVRRKIRARFGGRLKGFVSGGAALNPDIGLFFTSLGVNLYQGYGQTESAPVISCNPPDKVKLETVGPPLAGVEVKIAEDGEILVRGELVMDGYWNDEAATREAIRDGWLHTGDVGSVDEEGYIRITDRKKDIIVNSGGDSISPQRIEGMLTMEPEIAQAMVCGDGKPHLVALIVPDPEFVHEWARKTGRKGAMEETVQDPAFRKAIRDGVDRVNGRLAVIERVRKFDLLAEPFSIENRLMTATLKLRRYKILAAHGDRIAALY